MSERSQAVITSSQGRRILGKRKRESAAIIIQRAVRRRRLNASSKTPRFRLTANVSSLVFPAKKRVTCVYATRQAYSVNSVAGLIGPIQFRVNGMFDPQVSLGGIQPYGFDQWMAMYKYFTVVSAKMKLHYIANLVSAVNSSSGGCGLFITNSDAAIVTASNQAVTSQYSVWKPWMSTGPGTVMTLSWDAAKYFGYKDVLDEDSLRGTSSADPLKQAYVNVWADGWAANQASGNFMLEIMYDVVFTEPREVGES